MRKIYKFEHDNADLFMQKALLWAQQFNKSAFFDSSGYKDKFVGNKFDSLLAVDSIAALQNTAKNAFAAFSQFSQQHKDWRIGYLAYDLKNDLEKLESKNDDNLEFPDIFFFVPKYVFIKKGEIIEIQYINAHIDSIISEIENTDLHKNSDSQSVDFKQKVSKNQYIEKIKQIKHDIYMGEIYEMNYCVEFYNENVQINPLEAYKKLAQASPTPFSAFLNFDNKFLLSASPERYLKKKGTKIHSQPIKGTIKRGVTKKEDENLKEILRHSNKDRAENVMIVDLVRNDLSKVAKANSVIVNELFGIYTYPTLHQMISTIEAELYSSDDWLKLIKASFPMGSMTGAPKYRAMQLIEKYELTKRGLYSGAVGYITPENDFDFNVVIRTILYNHQKKYLSVSVGGAITALSVPEDEYAECLLKAKAMFNTFNSKLV